MLIFRPFRVCECRFTCGVMWERRARSLTFPNCSFFGVACGFSCLFKDDRLMWTPPPRHPPPLPAVELDFPSRSPLTSLPFLTPVCAPDVNPSPIVPLSLIFSTLRCSYQVYFLYFFSGFLHGCIPVSFTSIVSPPCHSVWCICLPIKPLGKG